MAARARDEAGAVQLDVVVAWLCAVAVMVAPAVLLWLSLEGSTGGPR